MCAILPSRCRAIWVLDPKTLKREDALCATYVAVFQMPRSHVKKMSNTDREPGPESGFGHFQIKVMHVVPFSLDSGPHGVCEEVGVGGDMRSNQSSKKQAQRYLAHKKPTPLRTPQYDYAQGPMMVLGWWCFPMSEVPL